MKRFIHFAFACALGWLGFVSGSNHCPVWKYKSTRGLCEDCKPCFRSGIAKYGCKDKTGHCYCKPGYENSRCNSCLKNGWHFNGDFCCRISEYHVYGKGNTYKCRSCACDKNGSHNITCNNQGQCPCKNGHKGLQCAKCKDGYYLLANGTCQDCGCSNIGAANTRCNVLGKCRCKRDYHGKQCKCKHGHYPVGGKCLRCGCSDIGAVSTTCTEQGQCTCKTGYEEKQCTKCKDGYYLLANGTCKSCGCSDIGAVNTTCTEQGQCTCKTGYEEKKCTKCKDGYYLLANGTCKMPVVRVKEIGDMSKDDKKYLMVWCNGKCDVMDLNATYNHGGQVYLYASESPISYNIRQCWDGYSECICKEEKSSNSAQVCRMRNNVSRNGNFFYILVEAQKATRNVTLHHRIGHFFSINPFIPARFRSKEIGGMGMNETKFYTVRCNWTCALDHIYLAYPFGGLAHVTASESNNKEDIIRCMDHKCICSGKARIGKGQRCHIRKSASSNSFNIGVASKKVNRFVTLKFVIVNYMSINPMQGK